MARVMHAFGRIHLPDDWDQQYPVTRLLPRKTERKARYWNDNGLWGDQGNTALCVAYAWCHWLLDGPVTHDRFVETLRPRKIYNEAQDLDDIPGTDYDGTTVRAGAKVLKRWGLISSYHWAKTLNQVIRTILDLGPVVVGTDWYEGMDDPKGRLQATGEVLGGHAYVLNGVNTKAKTFRVKNSWGRSWGRAGRGTITFADFERLLDDNGEACLAQEARQ